MKIAISNFLNPHINEATEEILLKDENLDDILFLYRNEGTIFFGRNQNVHEEINQDFVKKNNINLVRRVSGGGAVYNDENNICFSFITKKGKSFSHFLEPIIEFLQSIEINAVFKGKNDVVVDDKKISGNAQYIWKDRMMHHGTLLFDSNLSILAEALKVNKLKLKSKGIKSVRQRVANIRSLLKKEMNTKQFLEALVSFFVNKKNAEIFLLDNYKENEIKALSNVRKSNEWTYVKNPTFNIVNEKRLDGGTISIRMRIEKNKICDILIVGDFLSSNDFENIYKKFLGSDFDDEIITNRIASIQNWENYFGKISQKDFTQLILGKEINND